MMVFILPISYFRDIRNIFPINMTSKNTYIEKQDFIYVTNYLLEIYF